MDLDPALNHWSKKFACSFGGKKDHSVGQNPSLQFVAKQVLVWGEYVTLDS